MRTHGGNAGTQAGTFNNRRYLSGRFIPRPLPWLEIPFHGASLFGKHTNMPGQYCSTSRDTSCATSRATARTPQGQQHGDSIAAIARAPETPGHHRDSKRRTSVWRKPRPPGQRAQLNVHVMHDVPVGGSMKDSPSGSRDSAMLAETGQDLAAFDQTWSIFAKFRSALARFDQNPANFDRCLSMFPQAGYTRATIGQLRPILVEFRQILSNFGRHLAQIAQSGRKRF